MNKWRVILNSGLAVLFSGIALLYFSQPCLAQSNTVSGYVFGLERQPIANIDVELLDDFSRTVARVRTSSSGRYEFNRVASGRFRVRVLTYSTNYQEQSQDIEIVNINRQTSSGNVIRSGMDNVQQDFYLKPKKDSMPGLNEVIFAQDIPKDAKEKFDSGINDLKDNKVEDGLKELKTAIEIFPDYFAALDRLGTEYIKLKYYEAAQVLLTKAIEVNPKSHLSWYRLAYSSYSLNQNSEAIKAVKQSLSLQPDSIDSLLLYGMLLKQSKSYDEALTQLKKAKTLANPSVPEIHWQLSLLYANHLKLYKEAADELELYLKALPNNTDSEKIKQLIKTLREKASK